MAKTSERPAKEPEGTPAAASYDPSKNVLDLVNAAVERIDDMRDLQARLVDEKIRRMEGEITNQAKIVALQTEHNKEIRHMESDRVDKIRSVDVANAAATAAQLLSAVTTLATTAQATAETLRNQVAATAAAVASQTERVVNPIIERLALLEKSSNFGQGRAELANPAMTEAIIEMKKMSSGMFERAGRDAVSDPALVAAISDIKLLLAARAVETGKAQGLSQGTAILIGALVFISTLMGIAGTLYGVLRP